MLTTCEKERGVSVNLCGLTAQVNCWNLLKKSNRYWSPGSKATLKKVEERLITIKQLALDNTEGKIVCLCVYYIYIYVYMHISYFIHIFKLHLIQFNSMFKLAVNRLWIGEYSGISAVALKEHWFWRSGSLTEVSQKQSFPLTFWWGQSQDEAGEKVCAHQWDLWFAL